MVQIAVACINLSADIFFFSLTTRLGCGMAVPGRLALTCKSFDIKTLTSAVAWSGGALFYPGTVSFYFWFFRGFLGGLGGSLG